MPLLKSHLLYFIFFQEFRHHCSVLHILLRSHGIHRVRRRVHTAGESVYYSAHDHTNIVGAISTREKRVRELRRPPKSVDRTQRSVLFFNEIEGVHCLLYYAVAVPVIVLFMTLFYESFLFVFSPKANARPTLECWSADSLEMP